jgi:hypothetical protein
MPFDADSDDWPTDERTEPEGATFLFSTPASPFDDPAETGQKTRYSPEAVTRCDVSDVFTSDRTLLLEGTVRDPREPDPSLFEDVTEPVVVRRGSLLSATEREGSALG